MWRYHVDNFRTARERCGSCHPRATARSSCQSPRPMTADSHDTRFVVCLTPWDAWTARQCRSGRRAAPPILPHRHTQRRSGMAPATPRVRTASAPGRADAASAEAAAIKVAPSKGDGSGRAGPPGPQQHPSKNPNIALLAALAEQFRRESLPWIRDLVEPLLRGPPPPLSGTVAPEALADSDSRFVTVSGIRLHYKMSLPGEREGDGGGAGRGAGAPSAAVAGARSAAAAARGWGSRGTGGSAGAPRGGGGAFAAGGSAAAGPSDPEAAPALLLLHGINGSTFNWRLLMDDLAAYVSPSTGGCRVVAYDRPPYGLSQRPLTWDAEEANPYTLEGGARLACALLDTLTGPTTPATPTATPSPGPSSPSSPHLGPVTRTSKPKSGYGTSTPSATGTSRTTAATALVGRPEGRSRRAVLVGHSAGAAVAVETALRYPDRVCGLVLIAPAISTEPRGFLARADLGQLLRLGWTRALLSADGPGLHYVRRLVLRRRSEVEGGRLGLYADEREVPQEVISGYLRPLRAHDWDRGTLLAYRAFQVGGDPPPLERLRVPVLVLQGRQDTTVTLETAQRVAEALGRRRGAGCVTELVELEGCGHVPMDEQPLAVLQAVVEFVNRHCCGPEARLG